MRKPVLILSLLLSMGVIAAQPSYAVDKDEVEVKTEKCKKKYYRDGTPKKHKCKKETVIVREK